MKRLALYLALLAFCAPVSAQTPDTTAAWRYLPLEVGNVWEYDDFYEQCDLDNHCDGPDHVQSVRWWVRGESVHDGVHYFDVRVEEFDLDGEPTGGPFDYAVRFVAATTRVIALDQSPDIALSCPFGSDFGGSAACSSGTYEVSGGYEQSVTVGGETVEAARKGYRRDGAEFVGFTFAADIGLVYEDAGGYAPFFRWTRHLTYARVGGVEYGDPRFPVSGEEVAAPASVVALSLYPNPARGAATLNLSLDAPQRVTLAVYDVLGRRVLSDDLGALPAGEASHRLDIAALPPGVYLVRLDGEAGARATSRLVRQ